MEINKQRIIIILGRGKEQYLLPAAIPRPSSVDKTQKKGKIVRPTSRPISIFVEIKKKKANVDATVEKRIQYKKQALTIGKSLLPLNILF